MDEDKRYLLIPYGLLIGLLIRMHAQKDFSGSPLFIAIMTAAICIFSTWLVFRPQDKKPQQPAEQPQSAAPAKPVRTEPAPAPKSVETPRPAEPVKPVRMEPAPAPRSAPAKPVETPRPAAPAKPAPVKKAPAAARPANTPGFCIEKGVLVYYTGFDPVVRVPDGVHTIGEHAFASHAHRTVEEDIPPRYQDQFIMNSSGTAMVLDLSIPGNAAVRQVILPQSVTTIQPYAFYKCANLTAVELPDGPLSIGHLAFGDCPQLAHINLPRSVKLDKRPFDGCSPAILSAVAAATPPSRRRPPWPSPQPRLTAPSICCITPSMATS